MKITIAIFALLMALGSKGQGIDWASSHAWKLYRIQGSKAFACSADSLKNEQSLPLSDDTMRHSLSASGLLPNGTKPLWMGSYLCSCMDGAGLLHKIDFSINGSFFYDEASDTYYQLEDASRKIFIAYILANHKKMAPR